MRGRNQKKKREKRNKVFIVFVMLLFLVSSIGSVIVYYGDPGASTFTITSNGKDYRFEGQTDSSGSQFYTVSSDNNEFTSYYNPAQITLDIDEEIQELIMGSAVFYITFDPEQENLNIIDYLRFDIINNVPPGKTVLGGVTAESTAYELPVVTCRNATSDVPVILFEMKNSTEIKVENDYCIDVVFNSNTALQARDALVYLTNGMGIG